MPYCVASDVEGIEAGRLQGTSYADGTTPTIPSLTQVNNYIAAIYEEINQTIIRAGYQIPLTANDYLKQCNAMGAAWMVEVAMGISGTAESMKTIETRERAYKSMLSSIEKNPRMTGALPGMGTQNNITTSNGVANYKNPNAAFKIDERNW